MNDRNLSALDIPLTTETSARLPREQEEFQSRGSNQSTSAIWADYKLGENVPSLGVSIGEIVLNTNKVFIFINTEGRIEWLNVDTIPDIAWAQARVADLEARCAFFRQCMDRKPFMDASPPGWFRYDYRIHHRSAKRFIAQGVVVLFRGGTREEAELAFKSAENFVTLRGREVSLNWIYATFITLATISALALIALTKWSPLSEIFWAALTCATGGGVGAFISRALASREDIPCDANAGHRLHRTEAFLRWAVGVVSGGMICLLINGKVLLGGLGVDESGFSAVLALSVIAGMSERFLPSLLDRFNDKFASAEDK